MRDTFTDAGRETVRIETPGAVLTGYLRRPANPPSAAIVLNGATGVPQRFYAAFAAWLVARHGMAVLTFDYRDFAASGSPRGSDATMTDWGVRDQQAARYWLAARFPRAPLWVIGHSLGALCLPFQTGLDRISRVVTVASGLPHVSDHPWPYRALAHAFWAPVLPMVADRLGYLPAHALGFGHDLPAGVYRQWRRWCTVQGSVTVDPDLPPAQAARLTCPMRVVAVSDDALCPPKTVWRLMGLYPDARKTQTVLRPEAFGMDRIGHLDVLGARGRACWEAVIGAGAPG